MRTDDYGRARSELKKALNIDRTNTTALRYIKELDEAEGRKPRSQVRREEKKEKKDSVSYVSGNETIIQPVGVKDNSGLHSVINVAIGIAIGVAVMWFLILPAQQQMKSSELNDAVADYSDQVEAKTAALASLEAEMETLRQESDAAVQAAGEAAEKLESHEELLKAYRFFAEEDMAGSLEQLEQIDKETLTEDGKVLYDSLFAQVGTEAVAELYKTGYDAYQARDYDAAYEALEKCYSLDDTQGDALYFLARSCHGRGDIENARIYYQKVIEEYPNTRKATDSARFLAGLPAE